MYSDLFDQLGAAGGRRGGAAAAAAAPPAVPPLVSFKAGKMIMTNKQNEGDEGDSENNNTYQCEADTKRGEVRLLWQDGALKWQWYDRRDKKVLESHTIDNSNSTSSSTLERVPLTDKKHEKDRIYVWTRPDGKYDMYWMQEDLSSSSPDDDNDEDETIAKVNQYLADPASAAPASSTSLGGATGTGGTGGTGTAGSNNPNQSQVDALSSILENLGMPQTGADGSGSTGGGVTGSAMTSGGGAGASAAGTAGTGTLTLADLQGAMASMPQATGQNQRSTVLPLSEIVTPAAISSLLEQEEVCNRLLELLPEEQRSRQYLEENLRSPQIQQTLRSLTQALLPDDTGNMDGFYSVLANFQLDPAAGQAALVSGSNNGSGDPIQAFLDSLLASVEKEEQGGDAANNNEEDATMDEDKNEGGGEEKQQD